MTTNLVNNNMKTGKNVVTNAKTKDKKKRVEIFVYR